MKTIVLWTNLLAIGLVTLPVLAERTTVVFNDNWLFAKDSPDGAQDVAFDDDQWQKVRLPHDWAISGPFDPKGNPNTGKLPWQGKGWYRKHFEVKAEDAGKWKRLHYLETKEMLGHDTEGTVDGCHPNDLGMMRQGEVFGAAIKKLLEP